MMLEAQMPETQSIGEALGVHFRVDVQRRINGAAEVGEETRKAMVD